MSVTDRTTRRSDEIRRRRLAQSQPVEAAPQARARRAAAGGWLERLLGGKRSGRSAGVSTYNAVTPRLRGESKSAPPVMARRAKLGPSAAGAAARRSLSSRKVYHVGLGAPGVEARLPSLPRIKVSWRVASFSLLAFFGAILYWLGTSPTYQVQTAQINGLQNLTHADVNRALALTGKPVFMVDVNAVEAELYKQFPEFSSVAAVVQFPNTVVISVTERAPVLIWRQDGKDRLIDADGAIFPPRDEMASGDYPVVQAAADPPGLPPVEEKAKNSSKDDAKANAKADLQVEEEKGLPFLKADMVAAILQIAEALPTGAQIIYDPSYGFGWQDRRGWMVYLGSFNEMDLKLRIYRAVIEQLKSEGTKPLVVGVGYPYAPHYSLEP